jgi:phage/plasmid-associated DNA primase
MIVGKKEEPVTELWLRDKRRRGYDGICFYPAMQAPERFYNLWRGFSVEPAPKGATHESVDAFLEHARDNVCRGDSELFGWLIAYFAHLVQRPFEKPLVSLVFKGAKGVGKNALVERIGELVGSHFLVSSNRRYLIGQFNGHLENLLLFVLDEAFWSGDKQAEGQLKDLITGSHHVIEHKGKEPYRVENRTRVCIIGNEDWLVPASHDERRFAVFDVGDGRKQDRLFFQSMREGMEAGGYAVLLRYLLDYDCSGVDINEAPQTQGLIEQKHESLDVQAQWWLDCLHAGKIVDGDFEGSFGGPVECERLRAAYLRYAKARGRGQFQRSDRRFGIALTKVCSGVSHGKARMGGGTPANVYKLPPLEDARKSWEKFIGGTVTW